MAKTLIFSTNNRNKLREVQQVLGDGFVLRVPADLGITEDIPETGDTLEANASQKSRYVHARTGADCFSDDTGLEVAVLGGEPGVRSARYAGEAKDSEANMRLLLERLEGKRDRRARFRTVVSLILDGKEHRFEGTVNGTIATERQGEGGFGYDPIFIPEGYDKTFAEMDAETKNAISHRGQAVRKLVEYLRSV